MWITLSSSICKFYADCVVGVVGGVLGGGEVEEVGSAVVERVVVDVVCDFTRRRSGNEAVHTKGFFVTADYDIGYSVVVTFEKLSTPLVFADSLEIGFIDEGIKSLVEHNLDRRGGCCSTGCVEFDHPGRSSKTFFRHVNLKNRSQ